MTLFKRRKELEAEIQEVEEKTQAVKAKSAKVDKLVANLNNHLKDNNFGKRLYDQMINNWS